MSYQEPKTETETLSADERKLREMCISLKRLDAPKDFDFKLKARIADRKSSDFEPRFGYAFRYALPVLALIFVVGLLAFNGGIFSTSENNSSVAVSSSPTNPVLPQNTMVSGSAASTPNESSNVALPITTPNQDSPKVFEKQQVAVNDPQKTKKDVRVKKDAFIGSKDSALTVAKSKQPNFNANILPQKQQNFDKTNPMPVKEILAQFGINAIFENGKWTVKSINKDGIAESSGVRENDIIEAIDDQPLTSETVSTKTLEIKNITVSRNGEKQVIKLRNK